jgi:hypothetical protein
MVDGQSVPIVGGCQLPDASLAVDFINQHARRVDSPTSKRQQAALAILDTLLSEAGSLQKAALAVKERTGINITPEALRKATGQRKVGDKLIKIADALAKSPAHPTTGSKESPKRTVVYDDPYPNRAPAVALLRGLVEPETIESLLSIRNRTGDMSIDEWVEEGLLTQRRRQKIREDLNQPAPPIPPPPDLSRQALLERREKMKTRKR